MVAVMVAVVMPVGVVVRLAVIVHEACDPGARCRRPHDEPRRGVRPAVHRLEEDGTRRSWPLPEHVGSIALRRSGGAICSLKSGFHALDLDSGGVSLFASAGAVAPDTRINDGKVDRLAVAMLCRDLIAAATTPVEA